MNESDETLIASYVSAFERFDDMRSTEVAHGLLVRIDAEGWHLWRAKLQHADRSALESLYVGMGFRGTSATRFPPLYEILILSYRWAEVDLGTYRLLANQPAEDLAPLLAIMQKDRGLWSTLIPNGYVPFGRGADLNYDPVCFDFRNRQKNGDCRIVRLDHEAILCDGRIGAVTEIAPNFRSLVLGTIARADLVRAVK